MHLVLKISRHH